MEYDRFANNSKLYILGMVCLVLSLGFLFFSLFILPYLIWQLNYHVPGFILSLLNMMEESYNYSVGASKLIVWLLFFVPGLVTGYVSYFVTNYIDNTIYHIKTQTEEDREHKEIGKEIKESAGLGFKILGLMVFFIIIILLVEYLIQST